MALLLDVPFVQKDEAKALGARWNPELRIWYAPDRKKYSRLRRWIKGKGNLAVCDSIYIVEGIRTCYKCEKETRVIGFGFERYFDLSDPDPDLQLGDIHVGTIDSRLPTELEAQLKERYRFIRRFDKESNTYFYANHCQHCRSMQGNYFLFDEVDSPFFVDGKETAEKLTLRRINLEYDIVASATISVGSEDGAIRKYASIEESDMQWK